MVPCCQSCHDMKDLFKLDKWPIDWIAKVMEDFPKLSRETRIFLAVAMNIAADGLAAKKKAEKELSK